MRTSFFILSALCLGLLPGCASGPEEHASSREITSAFVADDGQLYLLPRYDEPMRFNAAPFREYRALMEPLRGLWPARRCTSMRIGATRPTRPRCTAAMRCCCGRSR